MGKLRRRIHGRYFAYSSVGITIAYNPIDVNGKGVFAACLQGIALVKRPATREE